jgi:hypothetical protein
MHGPHISVTYKLNISHDRNRADIVCDQIGGCRVLGQLQLERIQLPATHIAHDQR